jgi:hypothetical protein
MITTNLEIQENIFFFGRSLTIFTVVEAVVRDGFLWEATLINSLEDDGR